MRYDEERMKDIGYIFFSEISRRAYEREKWRDTVN